MTEVTNQITVLFEDFNKLIDKLDEIPKSAETKTKALLDLFFDDKEDDDEEGVFGAPQKFLEAINNLSEEIGYAYHTVLAIELARQKITVEKPSDITNLLSKPQATGQPISITTSTPQLGFWGLWHYKAEKAKAQAIRESSQRGVGEPQISTSKEVFDILEFGRQLIPEFNRIQEYYQKCIDHLYFFNDKETRERFHSELSKHLNKMSGIIRTFCRTITEYRKEVIGEHKRDVAKAAIALQMAEAQARGAAGLSEWFRAAREARGPTRV